MKPEVLANSAERWKLAEGSEDTPLLRLGILRDLMRAVHAERSCELAAGRRAEVLSLKAMEARIEALRASIPQGDLLTLLQSSELPKKKTRLLPESVFASSGLKREQFDRHDRQWETALAAEGCSLGWRFWSLDAWVEVPHLEDWNQRLADSLWPRGLILFTESLSSPSDERPIWQGRWFLLVSGRINGPVELSIDPAQWPGSPPSPPSPPVWKVLYSPRKH